MPPDAPLLEARDLTRSYGLGPPALDHVSLELRKGETLGVIGESGSGKSTLARILVGLTAADSGVVLLEGVERDPRRPRDRAALRRAAQFVFQEAAGAFNPRRTIGESVEAPMIGLTDWDAGRRRKRLAELLERVGLAPEHAGRRPHELSGGQLQRAGLARALATEPRFVALDEPVAALDVSVQAHILALLEDLKRETGLAMVFVSHDLAVVERLCDRVVVMQAGAVVEQGDCRATLASPRHDYTRALAEAARA